MSRDAMSTERKPMRRDAERNRIAILDAAAQVLRENPHASIGEIANRAGLVRVTLYGHFESRTDLVDAIFERDVAEASRQLTELDLGGDPAEALERLISSSWRVVHNGRAILAVAEQELPAARIRDHHDVPLQHVRELIVRGQRTGRFRTDLTADWPPRCSSRRCTERPPRSTPAVWPTPTPGTR